MVAEASLLHMSKLKEKTTDDEDKVNQTALPAAVVKALKLGQFTGLHNFWNYAVATRRAMALGSGSPSPSRDAKEYDWSDWTLAMLKLGAAYSDYGQPHLGRQVHNLLQGAMHLSAIYKRRSLQDACESIRRHSTSKDCVWSTQSLYEGEPHILLELIQVRPRFQGPKFRPGKKRGLDREQIGWEPSGPAKSGAGFGQRAMVGTSLLLSPRSTRSLRLLQVCADFGKVARNVSITLVGSIILAKAPSVVVHAASAAFSQVVTRSYSVHESYF
jgi:hypothetical protein